ncbi:hypothetical protein B0H17DRAFT_1080615 [Mycena rosella]|uniref:Uncharacterized protein n=1 Tax=Mycena rosella TaxID=1033263 RepID=A0AAD7D2N8_MYCRO|nr:hypothetical protein B0H17DRAFT_1080615 [Mycena rosella]
MLRRVAILDCALGTGSLATLCCACARLEVRVPVRDLAPFTHALAPARALRTLVDATPRTGLAQAGVRHLFARIPSLTTVVSGGRVWTARCALLAFTPFLRRVRVRSIRLLCPVVPVLPSVVLLAPTSTTYTHSLMFCSVPQRRADLSIAAPPAARRGHPLVPAARMILLYLWALDLNRMVYLACTCILFV